MTIPPGVDNVPEGAALSQTMGIPGRKQSSNGTQGAGFGAVARERQFWQLTIPPGVDNDPEGAALSQTMGIPGRKQTSNGTQGAGNGAVVRRRQSRRNFQIHRAK